MWQLRSSYHFAENSADFLLKIELFFTMLSNFEKEAAAFNDWDFWWVVCLTHKFLWSLHYSWCIGYHYYHYHQCTISLSSFRPSTKIFEFDHVKFPKNISSKYGVWRKFLEIESNSMFSEKEVCFKNVNCLTLFSQ